MARRVIRPSLSHQLAELFRTDPRAEEWSAQEIADHLGRNVRSVKEHPTFRNILAERQGVDLTGPERAALSALAVRCEGGRSATASEVGKEAGVSAGLVRRRLAALRDRGYATSRNGEPTSAGYQVTKAGLKALRAGQPRRPRRTGR